MNEHLHANVPTRPGEQELRNTLTEFRTTPNPRTAALILANIPSTRQDMEGDLIAFMRKCPTGGNDPMLLSQSLAGIKAHRHALRVFTDTVTTQHQQLVHLTDDELVNDIYEAWFIATSHTISSIITRICRSTVIEENLTGDTEAPRGIDPVEHKRNRVLEAMIATLTRRALETGTAASGFIPNRIDQDSGTSGRFGQTEVNVIDAALPPHELRHFPTLRIRRLLNDIIRHPILGLFNGVHGLVSWQDRDHGSHTSEEVLALTMGDISRKVLADLPVDAAKPSHLDLTRIADGESLFGWVRGQATKVSHSKSRDARNRRNHFPAATFQTTDGDHDTTPVTELHANFGEAAEATRRWTHEQEQLDQQLIDGSTLEQHQNSAEVVATARPADERVLIGADSLHNLLRIPRLRPAITPNNMPVVAACLRENEQLAARSLKAYHDLLTGHPTRDQDEIPTDAIKLWHGFTPAQADELLGRDPLVAHTVALAAILELPVVTRPVQDEMLMQLLDASNHPEWAPIASAIIRAFASRGTPTKKATLLENAIADAASIPGSPISDNREVAQWQLRRRYIAALIAHRTNQVERKAQKAAANMH